MAKRLVIDYGTDTLIDLDAPRQNLEQRFNLGGLVREGFKYSKKPPNLANPRKVTSSFHPHFNEWKYLHKPFGSPDDAISEPVYAKTKSEIDKISFLIKDVVFINAIVDLTCSLENETSPSPSE